MKKIILLLLAFLIQLTPLNAETPTYVTGSSAYQLIVENDNDILVNEEKLRFDFSKEYFENWSPYGELISTYQISNLADSVQNVLLGYPYISTFASQNKAPLISVDNTIQNSERLISDYTTEADFHKPIDLVTLKQSLSNPSTLTQTGRLLTLTPTCSSESYLMEISFILGYNTRLFIEGVQSYTYDSESKSVTLTVLVNKNEPHSIYTLNQDFSKLEVKSYTNEPQQTLIPDFKIETSSQSFTLSDYILKQWDLYKKSQNDTTVNSKYSLSIMQTEFQGILEKSGSVLVLDEAFKEIYTKPRLMIDVFELSLLADEVKTIEISSSILGSLDSTQSKEPLYNYQFLTQLGWKESKQRVIEIIPSLQYPTIQSTILQLKYNRKLNTYSATQNNIALNFNFTLSAEPLPKVVNNTIPSIIYWISGGILLLSLFLALQKINKTKKKSS